MTGFPVRLRVLADRSIALLCRKIRHEEKNEVLFDNSTDLSSFLQPTLLFSAPCFELFISHVIFKLAQYARKQNEKAKNNVREAGNENYEEKLERGREARIVNV